MVRSANEHSKCFYIGWILWIVLCIWFMIHDLGVYCICWYNPVGDMVIWFLRDKFDTETTASAYSVFNKRW